MTDRGFGLELESTYGEDIETSAFNIDWFSEADTVDFKLNDDPITKSGGSRMNQRARAGILKPTGSTSADADLQRLTWYFKGYLDQYKYTNGAVNQPNIHEFWGGEDRILTSFRGVAVYDMLKKYIYGMLVDGLKLDVSDDSLTVQADYIYKTEAAGIIGVNHETFIKPSNLMNDLFIMFYDISVKLNGEPLDGVSSSFSFDGKNNHDVDATIGFGSRGPQVQAGAGKRENDLTLTTTLTADTVRSILDAEYGEVDALQPSSCKILQVPLELNVALCEVSGISMKILFPKCTVKVEYDLSGADSIDATLSLATLGTGEVTLEDDETTVHTDMYVCLKNNQPDLLGLQYILYDSGVTGSANENAFTYNDTYVTATIAATGTTVANPDTSDGRVYAAQKPGTTTSAYDWEAPITVEFDIVEGDGTVRVQMFESNTSGGYVSQTLTQLGVASGGHVRFTYDGTEAKYYVDGATSPTYTAEIEFENLAEIRFYLPTSTSFEYKNFKIY